MKQRITVLGSTGSIGTNTLDVVKEAVRVNEKLLANGKITPASLHRAIADKSEIEQHIARDFLSPKQLEANGLTDERLAFTENTVKAALARLGCGSGCLPADLTAARTRKALRTGRLFF